jgi:hypothetical protein
MKLSFIPLYFSLIIISLLILSCWQKEEGEIEPEIMPPQLESVTAPNNMALNSSYFHTFRAEMTGDFSGVTVKCALIYDYTDSGAEDTVGIFSLKDDANAFVISGDPAFASATSGDVVAGDGIFMRQVNSLFTQNEGDFIASFFAFTADSDTFAIENRPLQVYENLPPQLSTPNLPDTLYSGFSTFNLELLVTDPQGYSDIVQVKFEILMTAQDYLMEDPEHDSIFTFYMEPSFSAGKYPGQYIFQFTASDSIGEVSLPLNLTVYIENGFPTLTNPALDCPSISTYPETSDSVLTIPDPGDTLEVKVTVEVTDPQTLIDIDEVYINYQRPTGVWTMGYPMADNGLPWNLDLYNAGYLYLGDENAGDGIYTFTKLYTSSADTGLHTFHFHCLDQVNQPADSIAINLRLIP